MISSTTPAPVASPSCLYRRQSAVASPRRQSIWQMSCCKPAAFSASAAEIALSASSAGTPTPMRGMVPAPPPRVTAILLLRLRPLGFGSLRVKVRLTAWSKDLPAAKV